MIHVIAIITANPGRRENILEHFRANVPAVRAEAGCQEYFDGCVIAPICPVAPAFWRRVFAYG